MRKPKKLSLGKRCSLVCDSENSFVDFALTPTGDLLITTFQSDPEGFGVSYRPSIVRSLRKKFQDLENRLIDAGILKQI